MGGRDSGRKLVDWKTQGARGGCHDSLPASPIVPLTARKRSAPTETLLACSITAVRLTGWVDKEA